jgi:hypothetical protein
VGGRGPRPSSSVPNFSVAGGKATTWHAFKSGKKSSHWQRRKQFSYYVEGRRKFFASRLARRSFVGSRAGYQRVSRRSRELSQATQSQHGMFGRDAPCELHSHASWTVRRGSPYVTAIVSRTAIVSSYRGFTAIWVSICAELAAAAAASLASQPACSLPHSFDGGTVALRVCVRTLHRPNPTTSCRHAVPKCKHFDRLVTGSRAPLVWGEITLRPARSRERSLVRQARESRQSGLLTSSSPRAEPTFKESPSPLRLAANRFRSRVRVGCWSRVRTRTARSRRTG